MRSWILSAALLMGVPVMSQAPCLPDRDRITFILGSDEDPARPLYRLAEAHFTLDPLEGTPTVIGDLRSLKEVVDYLAAQPPAGGRPWGVINLVVHANAQGLLEVPIEPHGAPTTQATLRAALERGTFASLGPDRLDAATEIRLHGCALGRNPQMLGLISRAFGGGNPQRPLTRASKWFTCFRSRTAESPQEPTRVLCENWDLVFRPSAPLTLDTLAGRFKTQNPLADFDPKEALARRTSRWLGDAFCYEAPLRFTWTVVFPGGQKAPEPPSPSRLPQWLLAQEAFQRGLRKAGIRFADLDWSVQPTTTPVGGSNLPSLFVEGRGRSIHLLRALRNPIGSTEPPPHLAWEDTRFYAAAR
jgi:hypothetical protein